MSRSHSYAQIPVTEAQDDNLIVTPTTTTQSTLNTTFNLPRFSSLSDGYARIHSEDDLDELYPNDNFILGPIATPSSTSTTRQQPAQQDTQIAIAPSAEPSSSTAAAGARRMIQQTMDGVFSNLSAKPRVEQPAVEELPPPYKAAALDQSPAYYETTVVSPFYSEDKVLVDGLPVGGFVGFVWNMMISTSFQFMGFFLTYLLHTSHATKNGSKMGLGITFVTMGTQTMAGKSDGQETNADSDTGYMGNTGDGVDATREFMSMSYLMIILGFAIILHASFEFIKAKRTEMVINATSSSHATEAETDASVV